jgi:hypothetical protein
MKVLNLVIESVKRVKHVVITPKGWTVKIAGKNQQGKTSILDALMYILEGEKNISDNPIHAGEKKGCIDADFGDVRITRKFSEKGSTLTVTDKDGKVQQGQSFINSLLGYNATDVMSFMAKAPAKQREILVKLTGIDTSAIDKEIEAVFADRTKVGHEVERLQSVLRSSKWVEGPGVEEISAETYRTQLDEVLVYNQGIKKALRERDDVLSTIGRLKKQIEKIQLDIDANQSQLSDIEMRIIGEELRDESELFRKIQSVESDNAIRRENKKYSETRDALRAQESLQEKKSEKIEALRASKIAAIAAAKFPIPGLSFGTDCVLFNGRPMQDASGAEQIMVGIAILSKVMPAEGIRILRCTNGSLIDEDNMRKIEELADREKVQVWIEIVKNTASEGNGEEIFIEDGQVKA